MTTDNDSVRADFQKQFPIPESCEWLEIYREYVWDETTTRHPHNDLWESWQASRERYVPRPVAEVHRNSSGQIIMRNMDGSYFDISKHIGYVLVSATPNGGNGE